MQIPAELKRGNRLRSTGDKEPPEDYPVRHKDERVIVIAPLGRDARSIADLLNANGFEASICTDPSSQTDELVSAGVLVMTEEALEFAQTVKLINALRHQPPWSELPLIIL